MGAEGGTSEGEECSFARKHHEQNHAGMEISFNGKVVKQNKDCLSRQVREGVQIRRCTKVMFNSKSEWFQPPIYKIRNEIIRE